MGSIEKSENSSLGVWGGLGFTFTINLKLWITQQLCRIILLQFGLITFNFHLSQNRKIFTCMLFRLNGRVHDSRNQLCLLWIHSFWICKKCRLIPNTNIFGHRNIPNLEHSTLFRNGACNKKQNWRSVLATLEKLEYGIHSFQKTRNGHLVTFN